MWRVVGRPGPVEKLHKSLFLEKFLYFGVGENSLSPLFSTSLIFLRMRSLTSGCTLWPIAQCSKDKAINPMIA